MLLSVVFAAALRITAAGDAFMVQGFPKDYAVDDRLRSWIASGDDAKSAQDIAATLMRLSVPFGTRIVQTSDGRISACPAP